MAKKKAAKKEANDTAKVNKSELVRAYMAAHPAEKPKAVSAALAEHGISPAFVSQIKVNMKKKAGAPAGKRGRKAAAPSANGLAGGIGAQLNAAVALIAACGSVDAAKEVLAAVGRLKSSVPF